MFVPEWEVRAVARVKVCVVAQFEPLRVGLGSVIDETPELDLVGEVASLEEMLNSRRCRSADVAVMDVQVAHQTRLEAVNKVARTLPQLKVLVLGGEQDARNIRVEALPAYLSLNGIGFLVKGESSERLVKAISLLAQGVFVSEMDVIRHVLTRLARWADEKPAMGQGQLTERETEVLRLVAEGRSNREIAAELFLSEGTVKIHISHIMAKLPVERRTELVRYAITRGLVPEGG